MFPSRARIEVGIRERSNVKVTGAARFHRAASVLTAGCTPDMGMNLWGGSPLWEFLEESM
jgi:hypothetical protein